MSNPDSVPWAIVSLKSQSYAISVLGIQEMLIVPAVARVPQAPEWVRGVLNLRGQVVPLIDLRKRLGMQSCLTEIEEFCELMQQREQDHRGWLAELEACVREKRKFDLTTDPHQCKFGRWYDTYQPPNLVIQELLKKFDAPHRTIHEVGAEVVRLMAEGKIAQALEQVSRTRDGVLQRMVQLFAELRQLIRESQREIAVVLTTDSGRCAVCVDSVDSVEPLMAGSVTSLPEYSASIESAHLTRTVGRRSRTGELVLILEVAALFDSVRGIATQ